MSCPVYYCDICNERQGRTCERARGGAALEGQGFCPGQPGRNKPVPQHGQQAFQDDLKVAGGV